ncbi:hypothetical protein B0T10DRAFT_481577 [Thelonectria olida]|uniref:Duf967 domain protein n=1 Tax=Thelonectria olida TaxID=1576542 RepID=A0A9P8W8G5_9HYPO|nr:hypothetical protein B0T10DRAFT_481577 [Thelonectria olida]
MSQTALQRQTQVVDALAKAQEAVQNPGAPVPIPHPSSDVKELKADGDSFTFDSFTTDDAFVLGNLLYARLLPYAREGRAALISIALANSSQVLFQTVTGPGTVPDNARWVQRKRNAVTRWGSSSWYLHCHFEGDETRFASRLGLSDAQKSEFAIHGGAVPIRVKGVEGIVATVVVSGLKQEEDHGVIVDVIKANWK